MFTPAGKNRYKGNTIDGKVILLNKRFDGKWRLTVACNNTIEINNLWDFEDFYTAREFVKIKYSI